MWHEDDRNTINYMICPECNGRTCTACDVVWHAGVSCADNATRRVEAQAAAETASAHHLSVNSKLCPQCGIRCEKVGGCDHITCKWQIIMGTAGVLTGTTKGPRCSHQYCWLCLADYRGIQRRGNTAHRADCQHHSNNLPGAPGHEAWVAARAAEGAPARIGNAENRAARVEAEDRDENTHIRRIMQTLGRRAVQD